MPSGRPVFNVWLKACSLLFQHLGTYVVELNFCIHFCFMINFFVVCWSSHTGKNWLWNHGVRWQGNNLFSRAELFARNIACVVRGGIVSASKVLVEELRGRGENGEETFWNPCIRPATQVEPGMWVFAATKTHLICLWLTRVDWLKLWRNHVCAVPREGIPNFKWQGWSNGGKNKNPKKYLNEKLPPPPPPPTKKENPMPNFRSLKVYRKQNKFDCTSFAELRDRDTRALPRNFRLFWIPKESLLKWSHPKKYLPNFPTQKNPGLENFKRQKILQSSPSLEIQSTPLRCSDAVKV